MVRRLHPFLALIVACGLGACGGGDGSTQTAGLRVMQASPDAPLVNVLLDGVAVRLGVDYGGGTGFFLLTPRSYGLAFQAILPDGSNRLLTVPIDSPLVGGREYTAVLIGKVADGTQETFLIDNDNSPVPGGQVRLQLLHAEPDREPVDIYLTAPDVPLAGLTPLAQLSYKQVETRLVQPGSVAIRITPAGNPDLVLFDSGAVDLAQGADLLVSAVRNTGAGPSPLALLVNNGPALALILDAATTTEVRTINAVPDGPPLDVLAEAEAEGVADVALADNLPYLGYTGYVPLVPDDYVLQVTNAEDPASTIIEIGLAGTLGARQTALVTGLLAEVGQLVLTDLNRSVATEGKIRIVDAAPAGGLVDVYIVSPAIDIATVDPTLRSLALDNATSYLPFFPGDYRLTFTTAGTKDVLATTDLLALGGRVVTVILADAPRATSSDGKPLGALVIDEVQP